MSLTASQAASLEGGYRVSSDFQFKIVAFERDMCLDIGTGKKPNNAAGHQSWATRLCFERVDGPSDGAVRAHHVVKIVSTERHKCLDLGNSCANSRHSSWATNFFIRSLSNNDEIRYGEPVGIFTAEQGKRVDIGPCSASKDHDSWATKFHIKAVHDDVYSMRVNSVYKLLLNGDPCLTVDVGRGPNPHADRDHDSYGTRLRFRRLDGESSGVVHVSHVFKIINEDGSKCLDVLSHGEAVSEASHDSWATRFFVRPLNGNRTIMYEENVGIFTVEGDPKGENAQSRRIDITPSCSENWTDWSDVGTCFKVMEQDF